MAQEQPQQELKHIIRIANVDLPGKKAVPFALTDIKGIGINFANVICLLANINIDRRAGSLTPEEVLKINNLINQPAQNGIPTWFLNRRRDYDSGDDKHLITATLNFTQDNDLKRLKKIKCYRGIRHIHGQPVRGQRTKANFRRNKGKVVGVAKKKEPAKADSGKSDSKEKGKGKK